MPMLHISAAPHLRSGDTTTKLMSHVLTALLPAAIAGIALYGSRALFIIAISVASAVLAEFLTQKAMKRPITINDFSAVVTGLLLAMNLPPTVPLWLPVVGSAFAIIVAKQLFGGIGDNFINPALAARAVLMASWPVHMTTYVAPGALRFSTLMSAPEGTIDAITSATPLALANSAGAAPSYLDMFLGGIGGCIGEVSKICLIAGAIYLIVRKVIDWRIPVFYLGALAALSFIIGPNGIFTGDALFHVLAGDGLRHVPHDEARARLLRAGRRSDSVRNPLVRLVSRGRLVFDTHHERRRAAHRALHPPARLRQEQGREAKCVIICIWGLGSSS